jgi:lipid A ethanolaminephosphotransferase
MRLPAMTQARWLRPALHVETLVLLVAAYLMLAANGPFWHAALAGRTSDAASAWGFAAAVFIALTAFYLAAGAALATRHTVRPLLIALLLVSAAADHYMGRYGVYFDAAMLRNVLATDSKEAAALLGWDLALHLMLFGVLPSLLLCWPQLKRRPLGSGVLVRLTWVSAGVALGAGSLLLVFGDFSSLMRNHKEVRYLITPGNIVAAAARNAWGRARRPDQPRLPVGADATPGPAWKARSRPTLFVLVVGETARAQNFSLGGYGRETNPELARRELVYFPHAQACGTSTEVSLPCMFSPFGRHAYDEEKILAHESLLHVLARAGFKVLWRDNQSGCKGVCDGLPVQRLDDAKVGGLCAQGKCMDEILLQGMEGIARDTSGNLFVVLHQMGSHGPAYFERYPPAFKRFTPACETPELRHCSTAEIVNAYDNSLLYTDYFLAKLIDFLADAQKTHDTAMVYLSDHGESLGEGGLYLHGVPHAIAPDVQTHVPFAMWLSPAFQRSVGVSQECMGRQTLQPASHDNLFHSLLGVLDVETAAYDQRMDLFAPCRDTSPRQTEY